MSQFTSDSLSTTTTSSSSSPFLPTLSHLFGWIYFLSWSASFYPQILLNISRRSTAGCSLAYPFLNISGFTYYSLSNLLLYYSPTIRREYAARNPSAPEPTVRFNDVFFAVHGLAISLVTVSQFVPGIWGFKQGGAERRLGMRVWGIMAGCAVGSLWAAGMVAVVGGRRGWGWLDVVYAFGYCKMVVTIAKYIPQVYSNHQRQSTRGWAINQVLMDLLGGVLSIAQLFIDSYLEHDWSGVTGNPVKFALGQVSVFFDVVFCVQHYVLYRGAVDTEMEGSEEERTGEREREALLGRAG